MYMYNLILYPWPFSSTLTCIILIKPCKVFSMQLCVMVCQWLCDRSTISVGYISTNKTDSHNISKILISAISHNKSATWNSFLNQQFIHWHKYHWFFFQAISIMLAVLIFSSSVGLIRPVPGFGVRGAWIFSSAVSLIRPESRFWR